LFLERECKALESDINRSNLSVVRIQEMSSNEVIGKFIN
jgi:hypothetical protein